MVLSWHYAVGMLAVPSLEVGLQHSTGSAMPERPPPLCMKDQQLRLSYNCLN